eukprot:Hpha_TRINITY_DN11768_c0_g1::TRINITY_DN11768_c0_g1_i1::g.31669::m.31669
MAHLDTATAPLADRAAMGLAGMAGGMMSEAELVKTGLRWWLRSMAGGWMGQWMEQFTTEDFEILDYNSTIPTYVCGQEGACKLYNALLSCHSPRPNTGRTIPTPTCHSIPRGSGEKGGLAGGDEVSQ